MLEIFFETCQQTHVPVRVLIDRTPGRAQRAFGCNEVAGLSEQEAKALQGECRDPVPRRDCLVCIGLRSMYQFFMVIGREPESTVVDILEIFKQEFGNKTSTPILCEAR